MQPVAMTAGPKTVHKTHTDTQMSNLRSIFNFGNELLADSHTGYTWK